MPMKELLHRLQPIQVYIVLLLSSCYFVVQMYVSQTSQSITLLVHTYHMLCNVIALTGCIIAIKKERKALKRNPRMSVESLGEQLVEDEQQKEIVAKHLSDKKKQQNQNTRSLVNTFGWARVEVLTMVIVCTFLSSFCFSIVVEVIQTFFHVGHNDHLEHQENFHTYTYETCIVLASLGLVLNGISYLLIGGYTFHQGSFLHLTADGNVYVVDRNVSDTEKSQNQQDRKLKKKSQVVHELARDACSAVMVLIISIIIVIFDAQDSLAMRLLDPIAALVSICILMGLSIPYMKEAGMILLQTVPFSIDIGSFQKEILEKFPEIQSIHELHMWELTHSKYVATAHMIFENPMTFQSIINEIINFFHDQDINIVTIQPEFRVYGCSSKSNEIQPSLVDEHGQGLCLVTCRQADCDEKSCCQKKSSSHSSLESHGKSKCDHSHGHSHSHAALEQVISVRNVSAEELSAASMGSEIDSLDHIKKHSLASLQIPPMKSKLHKTASITHDNRHDHHSEMPLTSRDIHLVSFNRVVSESAIKNDEHDDLGRKASEILVENRLYQQTNNTDNNETEDIHAKFDES